MKLACNYVVARFLPYPETGEFVNIGILLLCAPAGLCDFQLARRRRRVTDFFQELEPDIFRGGLKYFQEELANFVRTSGTAEAGQTFFPAHERHLVEAFRQFVRPRESLFRFSEIRTALAENPREKLRQLFDYHVERQFAREKDYQETLMANHLRRVFAERDLLRFYRKPGRVGDERYEVMLPFVLREQEQVLKAIKPLDLDKANSTRIYEHGDQWINRVKRLAEMEKLPGALLFPVREPMTGEKRKAAAHEIIAELQRLRVKVLPFANEEEVVNFAQVPAAVST